LTFFLKDTDRMEIPRIPTKQKIGFIKKLVKQCMCTTFRYARLNTRRGQGHLMYADALNNCFRSITYVINNLPFKNVHTYFFCSHHVMSHDFSEYKKNCVKKRGKKIVVTHFTSKIQRRRHTLKTYALNWLKVIHSTVNM